MVYSYVIFTSFCSFPSGKCRLQRQLKFLLRIPTWRHAFGDLLFYLAPSPANPTCQSLLHLYLKSPQNQINSLQGWRLCYELCSSSRDERIDTSTSPRPRTSTQHKTLQSGLPTSLQQRDSTLRRLRTKVVWSNGRVTLKRVYLLTL